MLKRLVIAAVAAATLAGFAVTAARTQAAADPPAQVSASHDVQAPAADVAIDDRAACLTDGGFQQAVAANRNGRSALAWAPFGRAERGWAIYEAHIDQDIATSCAPDTPGFAKALAHWQGAHGMAQTGQADARTLTAMKAVWQNVRPYVALRASGVCPDPPAEPSLARLTPAEGYKGKAIQLRADVVGAYRDMVAAARAEIPSLAADPEMLTIFSGYRSPAYDDARCARDGNCGGAERAQCSVHRTGSAFDLVVGAAPGFSVDSSADANRLYQSQTQAYRWLVANAGRFGFINYVFEPWHWEYVGGAQAREPAHLADAS